MLPLWGRSTLVGLPMIPLYEPPALENPSAAAGSHGGGGTEAGAPPSDDPHSPGFHPLAELTGICIGLAALILPIGCVLADQFLPLPEPPVSWLGALPRKS